MTARRRRTRSAPKEVDALAHGEDRRTLIPSAEHEPLLGEAEQAPVRVAFARRNRDLDPQLVWRGKDAQDAAGELAVPAPPLYIQERVHPRALIEDLRRESERARGEAARAAGGFQHDFFADFNNLPEGAQSTDFYEHDAQWSNRMILGDSLQVMASLAERERLRGQVQCVYLDPPYGIRFNSNFQWSTTSRDVRDGKAEHITREPEQVRAFRDTWRDGVHSYLGYLRDRLTAARDLLADSGSVFVQIGDENVHRVRSLMDEVFGPENFVSLVTFVKTGGFASAHIANVSDYIIWYARDRASLKYRQMNRIKAVGEPGSAAYRPLGLILGISNEFDRTRLARSDQLTSQGASDRDIPLIIDGIVYPPRRGSHWKTTTVGLSRLQKAARIIVHGQTPSYVRFMDDFSVSPFPNNWIDTAIAGFASDKRYVVETSTKVVQRCVLMATDPGDLVLDPTCGSGTTAYVAEQWGRRWITIDTSRVALALARARIMGARYPWYLLADSPEGREQEAALSADGAQARPASSVQRPASEALPQKPRIRQGFVYRRVPHVTLRDIANNAEIDVIHERMSPAVESALAELNAALRGCAAAWESPAGGRAGQRIDFGAADGETVALPSGEAAPANGLLEWEVPREAPDDWPEASRAPLAAFRAARLERQRAIDASIARNAKQELLYDRPYEDRRRVRVAGPFTVESLSPHRIPAVDERGEPIGGGLAEERAGYEPRDFASMILEQLRTAGVQQSSREDRIEFASLTPWPGDYVCAEGRWRPGGAEEAEEQRAGVFVGPEFGTVGRADLVQAAREASEAGFGTLIACAFSYDAPASEVERLGRVRVLKARMNADLHMSADLKNTGAGNLFVIFGEPDIELLEAEEGGLRVRVRGVDVYDPAAGEVRSDGVEGVACWFVDTDYNGEHFFVRHAYFLGAADPYKALRTTLKAEIGAEAWDSLRSDVSRPFAPPPSGRIAVKVINHLGDEVMKVLRAPPAAPGA